MPTLNTNMFIIYSIHIQDISLDVETDVMKFGKSLEINHNLLMQDSNWGLLLFRSSLFLKQRNKPIHIIILMCELKESVKVMMCGLIQLLH